MGLGRCGPGALASLALCACAGGPAPGAAGTPPTGGANQQAAASCDAGDAAACGLLGMSLYLEAREREADLEPAVRALLRSCEGGDWLGCGMAAFVQRAANQDARPTAARAFPMAMSACRTGDLGACIYVADRAAAARDTITAREHYRKACDMDLAVTGPRARDEYACRRAAELGAAPDRLAAVDAARPPRRDFRRLSGEVQIHPPLAEQRAICELGLEQVTARLCVCVSDTGVPTRILFAELSGARGWDRLLFEAVRTWRYTPLRGADGRAVPTCTGVTFHYRSRC